MTDTLQHRSDDDLVEFVNTETIDETLRRAALLELARRRGAFEDDEVMKHGSDDLPS